MTAMDVQNMWPKHPPTMTPTTSSCQIAKVGKGSGKGSGKGRGPGFASGSLLGHRARKQATHGAPANSSASLKGKSEKGRAGGAKAAPDHIQQRQIAT